jgi:hypothetical protein
MGRNGVSGTVSGSDGGDGVNDGRVANGAAGVTSRLTECFKAEP